MAREIFIDSFAGGGGASQGIKLATGRAPDIAINHDADAIAMHARNHSETLHVTEDVFAVNLRKLVAGRPVGGFWASPDCRDFSRAKGGQPVSRRVRGLAWFVIKVAKQIRPRVIFLENVREFEEWGPLVPRWECRECQWKGTEGQANLVRMRRRCPRCESLKLRQTDEHVRNPDKIGLTFKMWKGKLKAQGYQVEHQTLNAADYGAPTNRKRLFLVARCDGQPITWPDPTHAPPAKIGVQMLWGPKLQPYRTAGECLQWEIPCPSIFDRKKPLKPKSHWRTARGLLRYVLQNPQPFIVPMTHVGERRCHPIDEPLPTITRAARGELGLAAPSIAKFYGGVVGHAVDQPLGTVTSVDHHGLVAASLVELAHGEGKNGRYTDGTCDLNKPLGVVHAGGNNFAAVAASLLKFRGESAGVDPREPLPTITSGAGAARPAGCPHALGVSTAWLVRFNHGEKQWHAVEEPLGVVTTQGNKFGLAYAYLNKFYGSGGQWQLPDEPMHTIPTKDRFAVITVSTGELCAIESIDRPRQVAQWAIEQLGDEVKPFLLWVTDAETGEVFPLLTLTTGGVRYLVTDLGLRMLKPRELARCQGFPDSYLLSGVTTNDVARIGNSVSPYPARALVAANFQFQNVRRRKPAGVK